MRRLWLWGLVAEGLLFVSLFALGQLTKPQPSPEFAAFAASMDSVERGLKPPPPELTPAQKARLLQMLRDSLGIIVERRGNTVHVTGPPAFDSAVARFARGLGEAVKVALVITMAIFLPIPVTLATVTVAWLVARRRGRPVSVATAA